jgi:hypothetical protein
MWVIETTDTFDKWYDTLGDTDRANVLALLLKKDRKRKTILHGNDPDC